MNIRKVDIQKDYETLSKWWLHHGFGSMPIITLPKEGIMVNEICAGFIYQTDSAIAWMEYIISSPDSKKEERREALDILIPALVNRAKELGFVLIYTTLVHPTLVERYKSHGFLVGDTGTTHMVRGL